VSFDPVLEQIRLYARQLRLPSFSRYPDILRKADPNTRFEDLLLELMRMEAAQRQENQNHRRLKAAGFPYTKTLEELDLDRYDGKLSDLFVNELASCKFITEKKNVVMIGNPGLGKTHLAIALGLKACSLGMDVLFKNAATLSTELTEAKIV